LGLLAVKYNSEPIISWYLVMYMFLPFSCIWSLVDVLMGVSAYLTCFIPNLFNRSLMYLFWLMKIPSLVCLICNPIKKFNSLIKLILNLFYMHFANSLQRYLLVALNIISSTYIYIRYLYLFLFMKRVVSICQCWNHYQ
jgi:hypothetical protein